MPPIFYPSKDRQMFFKNRLAKHLGTDEQILALSASGVNALFKQQIQPCDMRGVWKFDDLIDASIVANKCDLEGNPLWKQAVVYVYVMCPSTHSIFTYRRNRGDARLSRLYSIGVGGHVNLNDIMVGGDFYDAIYRAANRELDEEVEFGSAGTLQYTYIINDNSNSVGKDHVGIVMKTMVAGEAYRLNEPDAFIEEHCGFVSIEDLGNLEYESWSRLLVNEITR